jgi:hypothetical protein
MFIETFCLHLQVRRVVLLYVHGVTDQNTAVVTLTAVRGLRHLPGVATCGRKTKEGAVLCLLNTFQIVSQQNPAAHRFLMVHIPKKAPPT